MDLETIQQFKDLTIKYVTDMQNAYNAYTEQRETIVNKAVDSMRTLHDNFFNQVVVLSKGYLESLDQLQESNQLT
jgi:predicted nucleotide-binding protein (sugar kinase/HSP70/actin superfamily)